MGSNQEPGKKKQEFNIQEIKIQLLIIANANTRWLVAVVNVVGSSVTMTHGSMTGYSGILLFVLVKRVIL